MLHVLMYVRTLLICCLRCVQAVGAPIGSVLLGSKQLIAQFRKNYVTF